MCTTYTHRQIFRDLPTENPLKVLPPKYSTSMLFNHTYSSSSYFKNPWRSKAARKGSSNKSIKTNEAAFFSLLIGVNVICNQFSVHKVLLLFFAIALLSGFLYQLRPNMQTFTFLVTWLRIVRCSNRGVRLAFSVFILCRIRFVVKMKRTCNDWTKHEIIKSFQLSLGEWCMLIRIRFSFVSLQKYVYGFSRIFSYISCVERIHFRDVWI